MVKLKEPAKNMAGKWVRYERVCGQPAEKHILIGHLTQAEAVLCWKHKLEAEEEIARQSGFRKRPKKVPKGQGDLFGVTQ